MGFITLLFIISVLIQAFFILIIFSRLWFHKDDEPRSYSAKVSVIVCARNEKHNLKQLIPNLLNQNYPDYEILIINDRSTDGTKEFVEEQFNKETKFIIVNIDSLPEGWTGKKWALKNGIELAQGEIILLTDADCLPDSENWIIEMVGKFGQNISMVLGYSPYFKEKTFLNKIIRFETVYTAMQYFSLSLWNITYMGVGRNLAYRKEVLKQSASLDKFREIEGGDDDLTVQEIAKHSKTAISLNKKGQTSSIPKKSYRQWYTQKVRHLSVGKHYSKKIKLILGTFVLANLGFYTSFILLLVFLESINQLIIIVFILRTLLIISNFVLITRKLKDSLSWFWFPVLDFFYYLNYLLVGVSALFSRKIKWI